MSTAAWVRFLQWLHQNITAGLGRCEVEMVNGRLQVRPS